jgi:mono/diheme cytochrome c family protein
MAGQGALPRRVGGRPGRPVSRWPGTRWSARLLVLLLGLTGLAACIPSTSEYPVDYFNEMHYQEAYRRQEPPVLSAPDGSVPITGGEPAYTPAELARLSNPVQPSADNLARAGVLYRRNCLMCHGQQGKADGIVAGYFGGLNAPVPKPYDDPSVQAMSDGQLYGILTNGIRNEQTLVGMPAWRGLLTPEERWLLVLQIRAFQGRRP